MNLRNSLAYHVTTLQANAWYNLFIAFLATVSLLILGIELFDVKNPTTISSLHYIDLAIAWLFLTDFCLGLWLNRAQTRQEYWRHNWLNLVSSIPISSELTQALRILRIWRAARILRVSANFWFARTRLHKSGINTSRVQ